jgi:GTP-binding protein Era
MSKSAFVAIVGRPSSGKSTLLNALCGHKVSIVSPIPQTTRNKIRGIVTEPRGQIVFIDTPGFHYSERKFNLHMKDLVSQAVQESDLTLYVVDSSRPPGKEEQELAGLIHANGGRILAAVNKTDSPRSDPAGIEQFIAESVSAARCVRISALEGTGMDDLRTALFEAAPEGEAMYPADIYTDQDPQFRVSEIIREKAMNLTRQEIPHSIFVEVPDIEVKENGKTLWIRAFIMVERESQKGIVVGNGGERIRQIRDTARKELAKLFPYTIYLDLRVKVSSNWRADDALLRRLSR